MSIPLPNLNVNQNTASTSGDISQGGNVFNIAAPVRGISTTYLMIAGAAFGLGYLVYNGVKK